MRVERLYLWNAEDCRESGLYGGMRGMNVKRVGSDRG